MRVTKDSAVVSVRIRVSGNIMIKIFRRLSKSVVASNLSYSRGIVYLAM